MFPNAVTYMMYKIGDRTVPCGTPFLISNSVLKVFDILTNCFLCCKYDLSRLNDLWTMPIDLKIFSNWLWEILSNAYLYP